MMPKPLNRLVAFFLVPCLLSDPVLAATLYSRTGAPYNSISRPGSITYLSDFAHQALAVHFLFVRLGGQHLKHTLTVNLEGRIGPPVTQKRISKRPASGTILQGLIDFAGFAVEDGPDSYSTTVFGFNDRVKRKYVSSGQPRAMSDKTARRELAAGESLDLYVSGLGPKGVIYELSPWLKLGLRNHPELVSKLDTLPGINALRVHKLPESGEERNAAEQLVKYLKELAAAPTSESLKQDWNDFKEVVEQSKTKWDTRNQNMRRRYFLWYVLRPLQQSMASLTESATYMDLEPSFQEILVLLEEMDFETRDVFNSWTLEFEKAFRSFQKAYHSALKQVGPDHPPAIPSTPTPDASGNPGRTMHGGTAPILSSMNKRYVITRSVFGQWKAVHLPHVQPSEDQELMRRWIEMALEMYRRKKSLLEQRFSGQSIPVYIYDTGSKEGHALAFMHPGSDAAIGISHEIEDGLFKMRESGATDAQIASVLQFILRHELDHSRAPRSHHTLAIDIEDERIQIWSDFHAIENGIFDPQTREFLSIIEEFSALVDYIRILETLALLDHASRSHQIVQMAQKIVFADRVNRTLPVGGSPADNSATRFRCTLPLTADAAEIFNDGMNIFKKYRIDTSPEYVREMIRGVQYMSTSQQLFMITVGAVGYPEVILYGLEDDQGHVARCFPQGEMDPYLLMRAKNMSLRTVVLSSLAKLQKYRVHIQDQRAILIPLEDKESDIMSAGLSPYEAIIIDFDSVFNLLLRKFLPGAKELIEGITMTGMTVAFVTKEQKPDVLSHLKSQRIWDGGLLNAPLVEGERPEYADSTVDGFLSGIEKLRVRLTQMGRHHIVFLTGQVHYATEVRAKGMSVVAFGKGSEAVPPAFRISTLNDAASRALLFGAA